jgi:hypothetical protein
MRWQSGSRRIGTVEHDAARDRIRWDPHKQWEWQGDRRQRRVTVLDVLADQAMHFAGVRFGAGGHFIAIDHRRLVRSGSEGRGSPCSDDGTGMCRDSDLGECQDGDEKGRDPAMAASSHEGLSPAGHHTEPRSQDV